MREIIIGAQIWTIDNLDTMTYRNGDIIPMVEDEEEWKNLKTGAWCYLDNNSANNAELGKLYNYYAIIDSRGLAPEGYRIAQHFDWLQLQKFARGNLTSGNDSNDNEELGLHAFFNAKPGGFRDCSGKFLYKNKAVGWWTSPESDVRNQGKIAHFFYENFQHLLWKPFDINDGFYVRCLRETTQSIYFHFHDNFYLQYKSVSVNYNASTTFQEVLNLLYNQFLCGEVKSNSYGTSWTIQIYDGERIETLNKEGNTDTRSFDSIIKSQYRKPFRLIVSLL